MWFPSRAWEPCGGPGAATSRRREGGSGSPVWSSSRNQSSSPQISSETFTMLFPCTEATYPYAIKNQRGARNTSQWLVISSPNPLLGAQSWFIMAQESWRSNSLKIFHHTEGLDQWERSNAGSGPMRSQDYVWWPGEPSDGLRDNCLALSHPTDYLGSDWACGDKHFPICQIKT